MDDRLPFVPFPTQPRLHIYARLGGSLLLLKAELLPADA